MKVGVLGSGDVAKVLGSGFLKYGHEVMMGTRESSKLSQWARQNPKGKVGSFADTARFGDLVVVAVKGTVALDALRAADQLWSAESEVYPDRLPLDEFHQQLTLQLGLEMAAARVAWCDETLRRVQMRLDREESPDASDS